MFFAFGPREKNISSIPLPIEKKNILIPAWMVVNYTHIQMEYSQTFI